MRVRSPDDRGVRRARILLEDAVRTASMPGADGARLLVVRSLDVGRIAVGSSATSVSLRIERRFAELARAAVHAASPAAARAPAVWFHDDIEPLVLLARRTVRRQPLHEWFWSCVLPAGIVATGAGRITRILTEAAQRDGRAAACVRVVVELIESGDGDALFAALDTSDGARLLEACGWDAGAAANAGPAPTGHRAAAPVGSAAPAAESGATGAVSPPAHADTLARWARVWSVADARSVWLGCVLLSAAAPHRLHDGALPRRAAALVLASGSRPAVAPASIPPRVASHDDSAANPPRLRVMTMDAAVAEPAEGKGGGSRSRVAGLFFLVPLIERAGIGPLLARRPELVESGWPVRLVRRVARRLRVDPLDPALLALPLPHVALDGSRPERADTAAALRSLRRWCRARARVSIGALVRRPGTVSWSRTHIDVHFPLGRADVRIRRAGLDIDPGWVPWLGRVVRYHYDDDDACDGRAASR